MFQEPQEVSVTGVQWAWRRTREAEGVSEGTQARTGRGPGRGLGTPWKVTAEALGGAHPPQRTREEGCPGESHAVFWL